MIGYVSYRHVQELPVGQRSQLRKWVYPLKTFGPNSDTAKVFFEEKDVAGYDRYDHSYLVTHLTVLELA